jgi:hypothetical protein
LILEAQVSETCGQSQGDENQQDLADSPMMRLLFE